jgi:hypothetical protein
LAGIVIACVAGAAEIIGAAGFAVAEFKVADPAEVVGAPTLAGSRFCGSGFKSEFTFVGSIAAIIPGFGDMFAIVGYIPESVITRSLAKLAMPHLS